MSVRLRFVDHGAAVCSRVRVAVNVGAPLSIAGMVSAATASAGNARRVRMPGARPIMAAATRSRLLLPRAAHTTVSANCAAPSSRPSIQEIPDAGGQAPRRPQQH